MLPLRLVSNGKLSNLDLISLTDPNANQWLLVSLEALKCILGLNSLANNWSNGIHALEIEQQEDYRSSLLPASALLKGHRSKELEDKLITTDFILHE